MKRQYEKPTVTYVGILLTKKAVDYWMRFLQAGYDYQIIHVLWSFKQRRLK